MVFFSIGHFSMLATASMID